MKKKNPLYWGDQQRLIRAQEYRNKMKKRGEK